MNSNISKWYIYITAVLLLAGFSSCQSDDNGEEAPINSPINDWVFNVMSDVYFWADEIPATVNRSLETTEFFESLLFEGDRFSLVFPDYDALISQLDGVVLEAGYELSLVREAGTENVLGIILYVKENSPAYVAGLQRGDIIRRINNIILTTGNYQQLVREISQNHGIMYDRYNFVTGRYETFEETLGVAQIAENPNFLDTLYTLENGKTVGYYVYNFFSEGVGRSTSYNDQMDQVFARFQTGSIDELVLDLRYNGGGSVGAATNLASLIAPGVSEQDIFYRYQWNSFYQDQLENDPEAESALVGRFFAKTENIGERLSSGRVFVLVGPGTASASELIINGLMPYMDVVIIGATTVGKNVGSIPIQEEDNPDNNYGLLPIVFRVANSQGQSSYAQGFIPGPGYTVDDLQFPMRALGDVEEPLLAAALGEIDGQLTGRKAGTQQPLVILLASTKQLNPIKNEMVLRKNVLR